MVSARRLRELATNLLLAPFVLLGAGCALVYVVGYAAFAWWTDRGEWDEEGGDWMGEGKRRREMRGGGPPTVAAVVRGTVTPERYEATRLVCTACGRAEHTGPREVGSPLPVVRAPLGCECPKVAGRPLRVVLQVQRDDGSRAILRPGAMGVAAGVLNPEDFASEDLDDLPPARLPVVLLPVREPGDVHDPCSGCGHAAHMHVGARADGQCMAASTYSSFGPQRVEESERCGCEAGVYVSKEDSHGKESAKRQ